MTPSKIFANNVFLPYIKHQLENADRVDVVLDSYFNNSLKEGTRDKRGKGLRRKVADSNKLPGKWQDFLKDSNNKRELFTFLSEKVATAQFQEGKTVVITSGNTVISKGGDVPDMQANDHEEADTKIVLHLLNALQTGSSSCLVRTVDTDVIVILTGKLSKLRDICPTVNIWVAFGTGKHYTYYHINKLLPFLGKRSLQHSLPSTVSLAVTQSPPFLEKVNSLHGLPGSVTLK